MKYKTGSGQRDEKDQLNELEQAACDYAGKEVILGEHSAKAHDISPSCILHLKCPYLISFLCTAYHLN